MLFGPQITSIDKAKAIQAHLPTYLDNSRDEAGESFTIQNSQVTLLQNYWRYVQLCYDLRGIWLEVCVPIVLLKLKKLPMHQW